MEYELPEYISLEVLEEATNVDEYDNIENNEYSFFGSPFYRNDFFIEKMNHAPFNIGFGRSDKVLDNFIENVIICNNPVYKLYRSIRGDMVWDFFIIGERPNAIISAFFKYNIKNAEMFIDGIYEYHWNPHLSVNIIKEYYFPKFKCIVSSNIVDKRGKGFFKYLAKDFIENGESVKIYTDKNEYSYEIEKENYYWEYNIDNSGDRYIKIENSKYNEI